MNYDKQFCTFVGTLLSSERRNSHPPKISRAKNDHQSCNELLQHFDTTLRIPEQ